MINQRLHLNKKKQSLVLMMLALGLVGSTSAKGAELVTVQTSRPLVARTGAWQTYSDHVVVKRGQEKRQLVLTFTNGADGGKKLTDVKVELARKPFATMKDFDASGTFTRSITGVAEPGNNLLTVQVFGPSGARMTWKLCAEKAKVTAVNPNPFAPTDTITVQGANFTEDAHDMKVTIAGKPAKVLSASSTELKVKPQGHLDGGTQDLVVMVGHAKGDAFKVNVKGHPLVTFIDFVAGPPGQPLVITGKGFSSVPAENRVSFGGINARVVSASETTIKCIIPEMHFPKWHVPITVTTNGVPSKGRVTINVDMRVIPNEGHPQL